MLAATGQLYNIGEKPTIIHCTLIILIAMQGHQNRGKHDRLFIVLSCMILGLGLGSGVRIGFTLNTKQRYSKSLYLDSML